MPEIAPRGASLIQRRGDAELPATGHWVLHRTSSVGFTAGRDRRQLVVSNGALMIADPPERSTLAIVAAQDDHWMRLTATTNELCADHHGFSRWWLSGTVNDGARNHPIELRMAYHGVRRRGDQAWAWITGRAATPTRARRFRRPQPELSIVLDLLFSLTTGTAPPEGVQQSETPDVPAVLTTAGPG